MKRSRLPFFTELKRRNVLRVSAAYAVMAWIVIQVVETIFPIYGLSDSSIRWVITSLIIGLLPVAVFAWVFEITPEGLVKDSKVERAKSIAPRTGKKLDSIIIVLLAVALGYFAIDKFIFEPVRDQSRIESAVQAGRAEALTGSFGEKSIAVLPFLNMSSDPEQEYFSDGISEELLSVLARIPEIRVISRASAFSYKGKKTRLTDIAEELNVAHILDGSVRKSGDRVRITAQLIDARSDTQLWSETFDRRFGDIFAIQDEIAAACVEQLKIQLIGAQPRVSQTNPYAYSLYLEAQYLAHQLTVEGLQQSNELFKQVLNLDPGYAPAWDGIANNYVFLAGFGLMPFEEGFGLANEAIDKALAIDPDLAHAHSLRGRIARGQNDLAAAARHYKRALELDPTHDDIIRGAAVLLISLGRIDMAMAFNEYAIERDPVNPIGYSNLGQGYHYAERWDDAIDACRTALRLAPNHFGAQYCIGEALLFRGDPELALGEFQQERLESLRLVGLTMTYHALGQTSESDAALAELIEKHGEGWAAQISYVYDYRNETDKAFEWLEKAVEYRDPGVSEIFSGNLYFSNIRKDPRWQPFLTKIGYATHQLEAIEFDVTAPPKRVR